MSGGHPVRSARAGSMDVADRVVREKRRLGAPCALGKFSLDQRRACGNPNSCYAVGPSGLRCGFARLNVANLGGFYTRIRHFTCSVLRWASEKKCGR